jgi:hypothetical protein
MCCHFTHCKLRFQGFKGSQLVSIVLFNCFNLRRDLVLCNFELCLTTLPQFIYHVHIYPHLLLVQHVTPYYYSLLFYKHYRKL